MTGQEAIAVIAGGAVGSVLRWWLARHNRRWPAGTFTANMVGSLALGLLLGMERAGVVPALVLLGLGGGVLGGLTTFSTLVWETAGERGEPVRWGYLLVSLVAGVALAAAGLIAGQALTS